MINKKYKIIMNKKMFMIANSMYGIFQFINKIMNVLFKIKFKMLIKIINR